MAIDTKERRAAVINLGLPFGRVGVPPDGTLDAGDRAYLAGMYAGIAAEAPPALVFNVTLERRDRGGRLRHIG